MRRAALALVVAVLTGCANTGVVPTGADTYMIGKRSPQIGMGPPTAIKGEAYTEANEHCAKQGKSVETIKLTETNSVPLRPAAVSLEFRCK